MVFNNFFAFSRFIGKAFYNHLLVNFFGISGFMGMIFGKFSGFMGVLLRNFAGFMGGTFTI